MKRFWHSNDKKRFRMELFLNFFHNVKQFLIAMDQLLNAMIGLFLFKEKFYADETLSAHAYRYELAGKHKWLRKWIDKIFFFDKNHCQESFENELLRVQSPPIERNHHECRN